MIISLKMIVALNFCNSKGPSLPFFILKAQEQSAIFPGTTVFISYYQYDINPALFSVHLYRKITKTRTFSENTKHPPLQ